MLQITKDSSRKRRRYGNGLQVGEGITVYIVGSLLGGTGSGMFLDLAYTVRNKFKNQRMLETVGMFSIPPNSEAVAVDNRPNAYAALLGIEPLHGPDDDLDGAVSGGHPADGRCRPAVPVHISRRYVFPGGAARLV